MTTVYVAVCVDCGWDCVLGVYDTYEKAFAACAPTEEDLSGDDAEYYLSRVDDDGMFELHHVLKREIQ